MSKQFKSALGVPDKDRILKSFEEKVLNYRMKCKTTNFKSEPDLESEFPYRLLKWRFVPSLLYYYWKKPERESDFELKNHFTYEDCDFSPTNPTTHSKCLDEELDKMAGSYHNHEWDETRPQWFIHVMNSPEEGLYAFILVIHHNYMDGLSFVQLVR